MRVDIKTSDHYVFILYLGTTWGVNSQVLVFISANLANPCSKHHKNDTSCSSGLQLIFWQRSVEGLAQCYGDYPKKATDYLSHDLM